MLPFVVVAGQGTAALEGRTTATGNENAADRLAGLLAKQGRIDVLCDLAATGNQRAADRLAEQCRTDEVRDDVAAGTPYAAERLRRLEQAE